VRQKPVPRLRALIVRFSEAHGFKKPNDGRALHLMNFAAESVMKEIKDVVLAFGESDEFR
jgi:tRNA(His) guanylyltransferase